MTEQAAGAGQITTSVASMRQQSQQLAKALAEQSRAMQDMTSASSEVSTNINLISRANVDHSANAENILQMLNDSRRVTDRNVKGIRMTVAQTDGLLEQAREVASILGNGSDRSSVTTGSSKGTNGAAGRKGRARTAAQGSDPSGTGTEDS
jgi:methyl-accepting chemotaxis protein